jgi:hypothetical protein
MSWRATLAAGCVWFVTFFALETLWVEKVDPQEAIAGALAAGLAAVACMAATRTARARYGGVPELAALRAAAALPAAIVRDTFVVFGALFARLTGRDVRDALVAIPFDAGSANASGTRRALVVALKGLSPNSVPVGIDAERGVLLVHELVKPRAKPAGSDPRWPL